MSFKKRLSRFFILVQMLKYKFLSDCQNVVGKARYISPVLLTCKGKVTILKGITIGENSVIGSCSVVSRDIPDNVIAAGNPAKIISKL